MPKDFTVYLNLLSELRILPNLRGSAILNLLFAITFQNTSVKIFLNTIDSLFHQTSHQMRNVRPGI
jgi:hypothetical protein